MRSVRLVRLIEPLIPFVAFDLPALIHDLQVEHFGQHSFEVSAAFVRPIRRTSESLASIEPNKGNIRVHEILNRGDTPRKVIEHILIHECLHLAIRPRTIKGRLVVHPPEFWVAERQMSPMTNDVWRWIGVALIAHLKLDQRRESAMIKVGWERSIGTPFPTLEEVREMLDCGNTPLLYI